jgi:heavy metal sensor kinase
MNLPIRTRLTVVYCAVFCLCAAVLETGAYTALQVAISAIADRDLQSRLGGVEEFLNEHLPRMTLARVQSEIRTHTALQPNLLRIDTADRQTIFAGPVLAADRAYEASPASDPRTSWQSGRPLRILAARTTIQGREYRLLVASDLAVPSEILHRFGIALLLSSPFVLAIAAAVGHWVAGRALSPVSSIATAARSIDASDLSRRIAVPESRDELRYLAETLNRMLARMENSFRRTIEFTANASHELRTPLAVIRATAEVALMRDAGPDPENRNPDRVALRQILREAEKNSALLEDLLRLARADSGTVSLRMKPIDLAESLRATCQRCEPLATSRRIRLHLAPANEPAWVSGDAEHLRRLLVILLDNAIKYTPPGGQVDAMVTTSANGFAVCHVTDTGIGISEADLPHIFERFFRSDRARNREEGGAGLGLAIAEWIAGAHRGSIEVESRPGLGSVFRVLLPQLVQTDANTAEGIDRELSLRGRPA